MSNRRHEGAAVIITNPSRTRFLVQRKDSGYPKASLQRTICLFGGKIEPDDDSPRDAVMREVWEEITDMDLCLDINIFCKHWKTYEELPSILSAGETFVLHVFYVEISDAALDRAPLYDYGVITEGYAEIVPKEYLKHLINHFPDDIFSSLNQVFRDFLEEK